MLAYRKIFSDLFEEVRKVVVGQDQVVEQIMVAILADGNALLEGYPGLAKTLTVRTLSRIMDLRFSRIQHTPDLMPSDITGTYVIEEHEGKREFRFHPGPIFANIVLADEINRASPKTQSALLEAMQEKQVTVGNTTYKLDRPFFVLATQNPIEQEGSLALSQMVFVNGTLKTGEELLATLASSDPVFEDENGVRLYDIDAWTLSLSPSGTLKPTKCLLYILPYKDTFLEITTRTGKKLTVTKNHPFLVNEEGTLRWKKAEELTSQDYLVNPARLPFKPTTEVMSHEEAISCMQNKPIAPIPFDEDFAFWIAFLLSDGSILEKCVEAVQKNYPEALDRFVAISKSYGFSPKVSTNRGCRYARIYSKSLVEYLRIRFDIRGGKDKEIPSWFLSFPEEMNREFLRTFISLESSLRDNRITFTQKSSYNVSIISYMLLREGIISWIRHDGHVYRMKLQGKDFLAYLKQIGWVCEKKLTGLDLDRTAISSFRVVPVSRQAVLRLVDIFGINSFHTLKGREDLTAKPWYGSYKGIKEGEYTMSVDSLNCFVADMKEELAKRNHDSFLAQLPTNPCNVAAHLGISMTDVSHALSLSKNQVFAYYTGNQVSATTALHIGTYLQQAHDVRMDEAQQIISYLDGLLSPDVFYDKVESIDEGKATGAAAFGLTVPRARNYLAGFGGCGINHNTYPLPEAQSDRFLLKVKADYPTFDQEVEIVNRYAYEQTEKKLKVIMTKEQLLELQQLARQVPIATDLKQEVVKLVTSTRNRKDLIEYGASPRASIGLVTASKARALINGRNHVSSDDIRAMVFPVLRHRILLNFEAERKGMTPDDAIRALLEKMKK